MTETEKSVDDGTTAMTTQDMEIAKLAEGTLGINSIYNKQYGGI